MFWAFAKPCGNSRSHLPALAIDIDIGDQVFVDLAGAQVFDRGIDLVDF